MKSFMHYLSNEKITVKEQFILLHYMRFVIVYAEPILF